jgi:hypothetical protein
MTTTYTTPPEKFLKSEVGTYRKFRALPMLGFRGQFLKQVRAYAAISRLRSKFAPTQQVRAYTTVMLCSSWRLREFKKNLLRSVGAYALRRQETTPTREVGAYASFKKLTSGRA